MSTRTTFEIDQELLERATRPRGALTTCAIVAEALGRIAEVAEDEWDARRQRQLRYFETLSEHRDLDVLHPRWDVAIIVGRLGDRFESDGSQVRWR